jgi:hypothetical protein
VPLSQTCSECESFENIRLFDIREVGQRPLDGAACRHRADDHADGHAHAPDARLPAHDLRGHRYAVELLHVDMIAQLWHRAFGRSVFVEAARNRKWPVPSALLIPSGRPPGGPLSEWRIRPEPVNFPQGRLEPDADQIGESGVFRQLDANQGNSPGCFWAGYTRFRGPDFWMGSLQLARTRQVRYYEVNSATNGIFAIWAGRFVRSARHGLGRSHSD